MSLQAVANQDNSYDVGSFDAKTYFAELLRMIQNGARINITKNGKLVAVMEKPSVKEKSKAQLAHERIIARANKINSRNSAMGLKQITVDEIIEAKNYGRK